MNQSDLSTPFNKAVAEKDALAQLNKSVKFRDLEQLVTRMVANALVNMLGPVSQSLQETDTSLYALFRVLESKNLLTMDDLTEMEKIITQEALQAQTDEEIVPRETTDNG